MASLTERMAREAVAIAAYESHVRSKAKRVISIAPSWVELKVAERQEWRYRSARAVNGEVS
jgi:hypothetical protein